MLPWRAATSGPSEPVPLVGAPRVVGAAPCVGGTVVVGAAVVEVVVVVSAARVVVAATSVEVVSANTLANVDGVVSSPPSGTVAELEAGTPAATETDSSPPPTSGVAANVSANAPARRPRRRRRNVRPGRGDSRARWCAMVPGGVGGRTVTGWFRSVTISQH